MLPLSPDASAATRITETFGLEVPLAHALERPRAWLLRQIAEFKLVVLRGPATGFDIDAFTQLMEGLGRVAEHPLDQFTVPGRRGVLILSNLYRDGRPVGVHEGGTYWHTDMSYKQQNCVLTALYSVKVPRNPRLSATEFLDCQVTQARLNELRTGRLAPCLEGQDLEAWTVRHVFGNRNRDLDGNAATQELSSAQASELGGAVSHPLVVVHPITQRKSLYATAATSVSIDGQTLELSQRRLNALLGYLLERAPRYTHAYLPGDVVIWDNLSMLHRGSQIPASDDPDDCRLLYRMNIDYSQSTGQ